MQATLFGVAWSSPEIGMNPKPNQHSQVKLVNIPDTHGNSEQLAPRDRTCEQDLTSIFGPRSIAKLS